MFGGGGRRCQARLARSVIPSHDPRCLLLGCFSHWDIISERHPCVELQKVASCASSHGDMQLVGMQLTMPVQTHYWTVVPEIQISGVARSGFPRQAHRSEEVRVQQEVFLLVLHLAVGETVILMTPPVYPY